MGKPLAERLGRAGVDVAAWNRTRSKAEPLAAAGVTLVDEPAQLAGRDVVFTMKASVRVREAAAARGVSFLAAPVSGNGKSVRAGLLSVVVSGPQDAFLAVEHLLAMLGATSATSATASSSGWPRSATT